MTFLRGSNRVSVDRTGQFTAENCRLDEVTGVDTPA